MKQIFDNHEAVGGKFCATGKVSEGMRVFTHRYS